MFFCHSQEVICWWIELGNNRQWVEFIFYSFIWIETMMILFLRTPLDDNIVNENINLILKHLFRFDRILFTRNTNFNHCLFRISEELRDHFGSYGDIESINVKTDPNTGRSRGFAFIVFAKAESLDKVRLQLVLLIFYLYTFWHDVLSSSATERNQLKIAYTKNSDHYKKINRNSFETHE